jgi:hypothetical protein
VEGEEGEAPFLRELRKSNNQNQCFRGGSLSVCVDVCVWLDWKSPLHVSAWISWEFFFWELPLWGGLPVWFCSGLMWINHDFRYNSKNLALRPFKCFFLAFEMVGTCCPPRVSMLGCMLRSWLYTGTLTRRFVDLYLQWCGVPARLWDNGSVTRFVYY